MDAFKINTDIGEMPTLDWVLIDKIITDRNYQREIVTLRVRNILKNFNWKYFQPLTLAEQADGLYAVTDGQQRLKAAFLHPLVTKVPAMIVKLNGSQDEADNFVVINKERSSINVVDMFWAGIHAESPEMLRIKKVLDAADCEIVSTLGDKAENKTNAVGAVRRSLDRYGDKAVTQSLKMIRRVWPHQKQALRGILISSLSHVFRDSINLDSEHLAIALSRQPMFELLKSAEAIRKISGGSSEKSVTMSIIAIYNRGRKSAKIELGGKR